MTLIYNKKALQQKVTLLLKLGRFFYSSSLKSMERFVPRPEVKSMFSISSHDFRDDLNSLPEGTPVYDVYAIDKPIRTSIFGYFQRKYAKERRDSAVKVGTIRLSSAFNSAAFGEGACSSGIKG